MSQLTEEQKRLQQIRERIAACDAGASYGYHHLDLFSDLRFTLSLLDSDSQAGTYSLNEGGKVRSISATTPEAAIVMGHIIAHNRNAAFRLGTSAMRDKCVRKVKELQDEWADRRQRFGSNNDRAHVKWGTMVTAAIEITIALERMPVDLDAVINADRGDVRKTMLQSARDVCEYCGGRATAFFSAAEGPNEARNFYHQHRTDKTAQALCKATAIYHRISSLTLDQVKPGEM